MKRCLYLPLFAAWCCALALVSARPGSAAAAPITITTLEQLEKIGDNASFPLDGDYLLGADIDAASATSSFSIYNFTGTFDGQNHTISNLTINSPVGNWVGLFGWANGAIIKNLHLTAAAITGFDQVGILAGEADYCQISNCSVAGAVTGSGSWIGSLVGYLYMGSVTSCSSTAAVTGPNETGGLIGHMEYSAVQSCDATPVTVSGTKKIGGLIGYNKYGYVKDCTASGAATGTETDVGGLIGYSESNVIENCAASATVTGVGGASNVGGIAGRTLDCDIKNCSFSGRAAGSASAGGIAGNVGQDGSITGCSVTGTVTGSGAKIGGIAGLVQNGSITDCTMTGATTGGDYTGGIAGAFGWNDAGTPYYPGSITGCTNTGAVAGKGVVGGIAGQSYYGTLADCANTGAVTGTENTVGGLAGYTERAFLQRCSSTGAVTGQRDIIGGLVGHFYFGSLANCYANGSVTGSDSAATYISSHVGGLLGFAVQFQCTASYSSGLVSASDNATGYAIGGLVGSNDSGGPAPTCFWDTEASGRSTSAVGTGKTTAQMKTKATFTDAGWDFDTTWDMIDGQTYPYFRPANKPPVAGDDDNYTIEKNVILEVAATDGVLQNDADPDGSPLAAVLESQPASGAVALNADGSFIYIPDERFKGDDSFTYRSSDGVLKSAVATVSISVTRKKLCPANKLYGETSGEVRLLHAFRDRVLAKSCLGGLAIKLYYKLGPSACSLLDSSPAFAAYARKTVNGFLPLIQRSADHQKPDRAVAALY